MRIRPGARANVRVCVEVEGLDVSTTFGCPATLYGVAHVDATCVYRSHDRESGQGEGWEVVSSEVVEIEDPAVYLHTRFRPEVDAEFEGDAAVKLLARTAPVPVGDWLDDVTITRPWTVQQSLFVHIVDAFADRIARLADAEAAESTEAAYDRQQEWRLEDRRERLAEMLRW
jgi:hypothetical protein